MLVFYFITGIRGYYFLNFWKMSPVFYWILHVGWQFVSEGPVHISDSVSAHQSMCGTERKNYWREVNGTQGMLTWGSAWEFGGGRTQQQGSASHRFSGASFLYRISGYVDLLVDEALVIWLNASKFNGQWLYIKPGLVSCIQHANKPRSTAKQSQYLTPPTNTYCLGTNCEPRLRTGVHCIWRGFLSKLFSSLMTETNMVLGTLVYPPSNTWRGC